MGFELDLGQWIVIALSAILFVWYILATSTNRRQGIATYRWLRQGLESLGKISSAEWIGASNMGARLLVTKPSKPFRRVEAHYLLEPREFLPYWIFSYLRGKRDVVVIKGTLRMTPNARLEIRRNAGRKKPLINDQIHPDFQVVRADQVDEKLMAGVEAFIDEHGSTLDKIILQGQSPHVELHARPKPLINAPPEAYFNTILTWYHPS